MSTLLSTRDLHDGHPAWEFLTGRTPFFAAQLDQRFSYAMYIPSSYRSAVEPLPLLVAVHGTRRTAERTRELFVDFAEKLRVAVLTPLFPGGIDEPNDLHNYKLVDYKGIRFDTILLSMIDEARQRWNIAADRFLLTGFSGGAQFVHRFAYLHPARLRAVAVGAPGRVTLPDEQPWPFGIGDTQARFGITVDLHALADVPMQVVVGAEDDAEGLLAAVAADDREHRAGRTRVARAETLAGRLAEFGISAEFVAVPGEAHEIAGLIPAMVDFLSCQVERSR
jgi:predicted peptidase